MNKITDQDSVYKSALILIAVIDLCFAYVLFTPTDYLRPFSFLGIFLLAVMAFTLFLLASTKSFGSFDQKRRLYCVAGFSLITVITVTYIILATSEYTSGTAYLLSYFCLAAACLVSVISVHLAAYVIHKMNKESAYVAAFVILLAATLLVYGVLFSIPHGPGGTDETAYNYYAAYLFVHGTDPYTASMRPILLNSSIGASILLNGSPTYTYSYPSLSFLLYAPLPLLGLGLNSSFYTFDLIVIFIALFSSTLLYYGSKLNRFVLLQVGVWIISIYYLGNIVNHYVAVSFFLFLAYFLRSKPALSGLLAGLAASTQQIAWIALPFFYIYFIKQGNRKDLAHAFLSSIAVFILLNGYFFVASPSQIKNMLTLAAPLQPPFDGPTLQGFLLGFFNEPYWYSTFFTLSVLLVSYLVFYTFTKSKMALIAAVPAVIFFFSWRNISSYGLSFVPLLLLLNYHKCKCDDRIHDTSRNEKPMLMLLGFLTILIIAVAIYSHFAYIATNRVIIRNVTPVLILNPSQLGAPPSLSTLLINVTNNNSASKSLSFYAVSENPAYDKYFQGIYFPMLSGNATYTYALDFPLQQITNQTAIKLFVLTDTYATSNEIKFAIKLPPDIGKSG
jgi:uncharacterized membrane protein